MKTLIIGGVAAGASTGARLRRLDESAEIVVLERGHYVSFANCGLPYHIGGEIPDRDSLLLQTPESLGRRVSRLTCGPGRTWSASTSTPRRSRCTTSCGTGPTGRPGGRGGSRTRPDRHVGPRPVAQAAPARSHGRSDTGHEQTVAQPLRARVARSTRAVRQVDRSQDRAASDARSRQRFGRTYATSPRSSGRPCTRSLRREDRGGERGFKRWSQHLDMEVSSGATTGVDGGADGASGDAFAGSSAGRGGWSIVQAVLGGDRAGTDESRTPRSTLGCLRSWASRWFRERGGMPPVMSSRRCRAGTCRSSSGRRSRSCARRTPGCASIVASAGPVAVDDLA